MSPLLSSVTFLALFAFVPEVLTKTATTQSKPLQCRSMHIYDPLGIRNCMGKYFDLCLLNSSRAEKSVRLAAANFGKCMANSSFDWMFNPSQKMPTKSQACQHRLTTSFVVFKDFQQCYNKMNDICNRWSDTDGVKNVALIVDGAKCILAEQKLYWEPQLWNQVACSAFYVLYNKTQAPIWKALLALLQCKLPTPTITTAAPTAPAC
ncbi:uncharacterized protein LOC144139131 [Haemaphysalis longicornis]